LVVGDTERFFRNGKLDPAEAARELGLAVGTIKSLWSRIRKTLNAA
jgi:DNA-directed RNA polymerase specialized sigma24 family protein